MRRAGLRAAVGGLLSLVALGVLAAPAWAHASLESSDPAPDSTVTELTHIDLHFSEGVEPQGSHVWIKDAAGYLELAAPAHLGSDLASLSVPVPALGAGDYEIVWHSLATDGHAEQGSYRIHLASAASGATAAAPADPAADYPPDTSLAVPVDEISGLAPPPKGPHGHGPGEATTGLARGALDASLAVLMGGLAFLVVVWPRGLALFRARQVLWAAAGVAAIASVELTAFQHAGATGTSTLAALAPGQLVQAMDFRFGRVAAARLLLIAASLLLVARLAPRRGRGRASRRWRGLAAAVVLGLGETLVLLGHGSGVVTVEAIARLVHVVGISAWLGGLVMLVAVVLPRQRADELLTVLPRFSRFATASIGVLVVGGAALSVDLVGSVGALTSTSYGRALVAKLVVVGLLLIAATASRAHVRSCLRSAGDLSGSAIARPLVAWVGIEVGLMAAVLAITAVLVSRVPPA
jgi:putative copper export protein/methionine-rich copper-binding protein CopC